MTEIHKIIDIVGEFKKGLTKKAEKYLKELEPMIVDDIFEEQLYDKGISGSGKSLGEYSDNTIFRKRAKGQKTSNITLRDTKDFMRGGKALIKGIDVEIISTDSKMDLLKDSFGSDILELTKENLVDKQDIVSDDIKTEFKEMFI